jgi:hypothetical protein
MSACSNASEAIYSTVTLKWTVSVAVLPAMGLRSIGDALVRQLMLVPDGIQNAATAGKAKAEDPGEIPH